MQMQTQSASMQQPQMQLQGLPSNSSSSSGNGGGWYGLGSVRQQQQQQAQMACRSFPSGSTGQCFPDNYVITAGTGSNGGRGVVGYYDGPVMQKIPANHVHANYRQMGPSCYGSSGMVPKTELMMESPGVMQHHMIPAGSRSLQVMNPSNDSYPEHRITSGMCRPMYPQQFDPGVPGQGGPMMGTMEGTRMPMGHGIPVGPELNHDGMVCHQMPGEPLMRASMHPQRTLMYTNPQQRAMPYPNPQQYMQNKRAQYSARQKMYGDFDPPMQHYSNGCYGNSWPRQPVPPPQQQQQPMVSPGGYPCIDAPYQVKEEVVDPYVHMGVQNQCQLPAWHSSQLAREPLQGNNSFSPPPGNPTPPMTPGASSSVPCNLPLEPSDIRLNGPRPYRENEQYFTFAVREGMIRPPFQLEHDLPVSCHIFNLHEQMHESLMSKPDFELMLKCFHKEDRSLTTNWPPSVSISLNEVPLLIDRGNPIAPHHQPMFLKSVCKPGQNSLKISVKACCCSHLFILQIVHRPSVRSVLQNLLTKRLLPAHQATGKIKRIINQMSMMSPGIVNEQQTITIPLTCPIIPMSAQRIVLPARGRECRHIQCFDLETYLKINCERNHWVCPVCKKMAAIDGLEVDQYIWGILVHLSSAYSDAIIFDASASWKPVPKSGLDYGGDVNQCKKFISVNSMSLPNPSTYLANRGLTNNSLVSSVTPVGSAKENTLQERQGQKPRPGDPTTNYLGCLSQMTDVFLCSDGSPNMAHQTNGLEHVSFPPTPMGSQISQICTPLDGQSLHPRTPSDGHATHPHTPPDGYPFTPLDSQSVYVKTPGDNHSGTPRTPSAAYDSCGGKLPGIGVPVQDGCGGTGLCSGSGVVGGLENVKSEYTQDQLNASNSVNNLTKLDFKSEPSMESLMGLTDDGDDMFNLVPDVFDDDPSDLTSYLGPESKMSASKTIAANREIDDDFLSLLS